MRRGVGACRRGGGGAGPARRSPGRRRCPGCRGRRGAGRQPPPPRAAGGRGGGSRRGGAVPADLPAPCRARRRRCWVDSPWIPGECGPCWGSLSELCCAQRLDGRTAVAGAFPAAAAAVVALRLLVPESVRSGSDFRTAAGTVWTWVLVGVLLVGAAAMAVLARRVPRVVTPALDLSAPAGRGAQRSTGASAKRSTGASAQRSTGAGAKRSAGAKVGSPSARKGKRR